MKIYILIGVIIYLAVGYFNYRRLVRKDKVLVLEAGEIFALILVFPYFIINK